MVRQMQSGGIASLVHSMESFEMPRIIWIKHKGLEDEKPSSSDSLILNWNPWLQGSSVLRDQINLLTTQLCNALKASQSIDFFYLTHPA